jgi:hypothetical protein
MLHAFDEMVTDGNRIVSTRNNAKLEIHLACSQGLRLSQTDQFATPYNQGIPQAYHREKPNHWHVTAQTSGASKVAQIAAVMVVTNPRDQCEFQLQDRPGWLGVRAQGSFGQTTGWMRIEQGHRRPRDIPNGAKRYSLWTSRLVKSGNTP